MNRLFRISTGIATLILIFSGCNQTSREAKSKIEVKDTILTTSEDTIIHNTINDDFFLAKVKRFSTQNSKYNSVYDLLIDTIHNPTDHWLLETVNKKRSRYKESNRKIDRQQLLKLPNDHDLQDIVQIRQSLFYTTYKNSNDVVMEQWQLKDVQSAEKWLAILTDSLRGSTFTKPPRFQWVEGNFLYMVSTRSAAQWHENSDMLLENLTGKIRTQLVNLYRPINIPHFKKWQGPAHSSPFVEKNNHLYTTSKGPFYSYYFFKKHRKIARQRTQPTSEFIPKSDFLIITSLHAPLTGNEKYNSIKESLVSVKSTIEDEALNQLNLVGKSLSKVEERYGTALLEKKNKSIYGHANRIVVVLHENDKAKAFKYLKIRDTFTSLQNDASALSWILEF